MTKARTRSLDHEIQPDRSYLEIAQLKATAGAQENKFPSNPTKRGKTLLQTRDALSNAVDLMLFALPCLQNYATS
jgi:hypothetical protein